MKLKIRYCEANKYLEDGWIIALPEEDQNHSSGIVYLEKRVGK